MTILEWIADLKDSGVSGEYDENPVTRGEMAEILKALLEVMD